MTGMSGKIDLGRLQRGVIGLVKVETGKGLPGALKQRNGKVAPAGAEIGSPAGELFREMLR